MSAHSASVQPRLGCNASRDVPPSDTKSTAASSAVYPRVAQALTWPSPRCSRRLVASCHSAATGSSGRPRLRFAANSGLPPGDPLRLAASSAARSQSSARIASSWPPARRRSAAAALVDRAWIRADGAATSQMEGTARSTIDGANPKKAAVTVPAEQAPSGAAR